MRDHVVTELLQSKNLSKSAKNRQNSLNFISFSFLEALKLHGRARNLKYQLEGFPPDILVPISNR